MTLSDYNKAKAKAQTKANRIGVPYAVKKNHIFGGYIVYSVSSLEIHQTNIGELVYPRLEATQ